MLQSFKNLWQKNVPNRKGINAFSIGAAAVYIVWTVMSFFIAALIVAVLLHLLNAIGVPVDSLSSDIREVVFAALTYVGAIALVTQLPRIVFASHTTRRDIAFDRLLSWSDMGLGLVGFVPYIAISIAITAITTALVSGFDVNQVQDVGFSHLLTRESFIVAFVALVVIAPIAEEILFRGYLYGKIKKHIGVVGATILTSVCFGLIHLQANVAVDVFALSIILCILRELTGSIWAGICLHMIKNGIAFYVLFLTQFSLF